MQSSVEAFLFSVCKGRRCAEHRPRPNGVFDALAGLDRVRARVAAMERIFDGLPHETPAQMRQLVEGELEAAVVEEVQLERKILEMNPQDAAESIALLLLAADIVARDSGNEEAWAVCVALRNLARAHCCRHRRN